jgi:vacuolar protein sorting-associated protein 13D
MYVCALPFSNWSLFSDFYQAEEEPFTKDWMVIERRGGLRQTTVTSGNTNDQNNKRTEIQMRLAGGIGISLINGVPEELVFATFNPIEVSATRYQLFR